MPCEHDGNLFSAKVLDLLRDLALSMPSYEIWRVIILWQVWHDLTEFSRP